MKRQVGFFSAAIEEQVNLFYVHTNAERRTANYTNRVLYFTAGISIKKVLQKYESENEVIS